MPIDYTAASCTCADTLQFPAYTDPGCDYLDGDLFAVMLVLCGYSVECWQDQTELETLISNRQAVVVGRITGTVDDPTENEIELPFARMPKRTVKDRDHSVTFQVPFKKENYEFWNSLSPIATLGAFAYVDKSGTLYEAPADPSISVYYSQINGIKVVNATVAWTTTALEKPYDALQPVFSA